MLSIDKAKPYSMYGLMKLNERKRKWSLVKPVAAHIPDPFISKLEFRFRMMLFPKRMTCGLSNLDLKNMTL